eukprot:3632164-Pleurochrysis_carterae.AAC.3
MPFCLAPPPRGLHPSPPSPSRSCAPLPFSAGKRARARGGLGVPASQADLPGTAEASDVSRARVQLPQAVRRSLREATRRAGEV